MARLVGYTMRFKGGGLFTDYYLTPCGAHTEYAHVLCKEKVKELWLEYANSGAFFQLPTLCPVYDYRRRC
jgi:hypothetical protein